MMEKLSLKRLALVGVVFVFNAVLAFRTQIVFFRFLFWFLIAVILLDIFVMAATRYGTRVIIRRRHPVRLIEGEMVQIETEIENEGVAATFNIVVEDEFFCAPPGQRLQRAGIDFLPPQYPLMMRYECICEIRGKYALGPCRVYYSDFWASLHFAEYLKTQYRIYTSIPEYLASTDFLP